MYDNFFPTSPINIKIGDGEAVDDTLEEQQIEELMVGVKYNLGIHKYQKSKIIYDSFPKNSNENKENEHIHHQINRAYLAKTT